MNNIQLQYQSVIKTPNLWNSTSSTFYNLEQYAIPQKKICKISYDFFDKNLRLGHKVEYFLNHFLSIECGNDLLLKNTQISASPQETLGDIPPPAPKPPPRLSDRPGRSPRCQPRQSHNRLLPRSCAPSQDARINADIRAFKTVHQHPPYEHRPISTANNAQSRFSSFRARYRIISCRQKAPRRGHHYMN